MIIQEKYQYSGDSAEESYRNLPPWSEHGEGAQRNLDFWSWLWGFLQTSQYSNRCWVGSQRPKSCLKTYTTPASKDVSRTFLFPFIKQNQWCEEICLSQALWGLISKCLSCTRKVEHSGLNAEQHYKLGFYLIPRKNIITHYYWVFYAI